MPQNEGQQRAADRVASELAERGWSNADLSRATDFPDTDDPPVDLGTIGDFLAYKRWPKVKTLGRIERAFGWVPGSLRQVALRGGDVQKIERDAPVDDTPVGAGVDAGELADLNPDEMRQVLEYAALLKAARKGQ